MLTRLAIHCTSKFVTQYPRWFLCSCFIIILILATGSKNLSFNNEYRAFFGKENPQLLSFEYIQASYNKSDNVLFVIETVQHDVFNLQDLQAIHQLTERAWQIPHASRVDSITNFQHSFAVEDELIVSDLVTASSSLTDSDIQRIKQVALSEPLLVNRLVSKSGHVSGINVTVQLPENEPLVTIEISNKARSMAAEIEKSFPGLTVHITGVIMINNAFIESALSDNKILLPIMFVLVMALLLFFLKSVSATFCVVLIIVLSVLPALGIFGWLGWVLTPPSSSAPIIILTIAVADCVHILVTVLHQMKTGLEKKLAIQESLRINFQPVFLTSITTALGFLCMNFSDAPPYRDLGNLVAFGVVIAFFLTIMLLPALLMLLPIRIKKGGKIDNSFVSRLAEFVVLRRTPLLLIFGILVILISSFAPKNELNDELIKYFDTSVEIRRATDFLNANMGGTYTIEIELSTDNEGGLNEPAFLKKIERLSSWLKIQPEVIHVNTITDTFKRLNKNMHGDDPAKYNLPTERELAAQYLLMYEMSLPYGLDLNDQINIDKSGTRIIATLESLSSNEMLAVEARLNDWLQNNIPDVHAVIASPTIMFSHISKRNIVSMVEGTLMALILISFILIGAFRSFKLGLLSLIPNLAPAAVAFGIWALIDGQISLGLSIVTGMTLGIVVDDTVHFISKYRRARIEKDLSCEDAVRYAFSTVGSAMWITSIVLIGGFWVLSFSHFTINSQMGLFSAITIAIALMLDLLLLPPLLMALDRK